MVRVTRGLITFPRRRRPRWLLVAAMTACCLAIAAATKFALTLEMTTGEARVLARSINVQDRINAAKVLHRDMDQSLNVLREMAAANDEASPHAQIFLRKLGEKAR